MTKKSKKLHSGEVSPAITHFPTPMLKKNAHLSDEKKIEIIAEHFKGIMEVLGLDLTNNSLVKTPYRVAKMFVQEVFSGLNEKNFPSILFFEEEFHGPHEPSMILTKVGFTSFCEHHFVPMTGFAHVAYLPNKKIIGISKIPRLVRYFANRPQLQERLTAQIADSLAILLESEDVAVSIFANHQCVIARGIQDENNHTTTHVLRGQFQNNQGIRQEFFEALRH